MERLSQKTLHKMLLYDLDEHVAAQHSDISKKPLLIDLDSYPSKLKVYLFNCTCPPGGRTTDEYKIQLILENQKRNERCHIDNSDGRTVLLMGYAIPLIDVEDGVYIIWQTDMHVNAAYSANLQVTLPYMLKALATDVFTYKKYGNNERMVLCDRKHIYQAIKKRKDWDTEEMIK
ncbi:hypothetical protein [Clostridium sp. KNHs216]|uniref:hypothetical protein n=1 Tax=Clostridium sp. KNHs216 TaxID=1550235 RepID=UPI0011541002|nr:hypothetical protein [Clostridium sp. KNHs216]TQI67891.1 hypothetical protein LY85_2603 [Clostridium sp. KNHs216]